MTSTKTFVLLVCFRLFLLLLSQDKMCPSDGPEQNISWNIIRKHFLSATYSLVLCTDGRCEGWRAAVLVVLMDNPQSSETLTRTCGNCRRGKRAGAEGCAPEARPLREDHDQHASPLPRHLMLRRLQLLCWLEGKLHTFYSTRIHVKLWLQSVIPVFSRRYFVGSWAIVPQKKHQLGTLPLGVFFMFFGRYLVRMVFRI